MRRIVLQMMTTLNGRLDDPMAWLHGVDDDQYRDIDRLYAEYDTVLVGRTTYEEMAAYWPGALEEGTEANRSMARRMRDYRKLVFSRTGREPLTEWTNVERVTVADDNALKSHLDALKAGEGRDIHLSGGAGFAQSVIALGLVDEYRFFIYPTVSPGTAWFAPLTEKLDLTLIASGTYGNGVVRVQYVPRAPEDKVKPASFTDLLT